MGEKDLCSWYTLISGLARFGRIDGARKLFDKMPETDDFSWNAMISGYVKHNKPKDALELYSRMMQKKRKGKLVCGNKFTVSSALAAAASNSVSVLGEGDSWPHCSEWVGFRCSGALSDLYGKCGSLDEARCVFDRTVERDVVSRTAMMDRYFGDGRWEEGLSLFSDLLNSGIRPNECSGVLNACAQQTIEGLSKQVHGYMMRSGFDPFSFAANALVHMYSKCGNMESAYKQCF
ncbi:hypothetical protein ACH5RR_011397 [Cinchona calisaya]|uniref:Pentatricopeptide repeat-containing protein n=1 Tax=Cinchona calisaya TaxID=153742 RepID=A0ABD3A4S9_9GENT